MTIRWTTMRPRLEPRHVALLLSGALLLLRAPPARAGEEAAAEALFLEAKKLVAQNRHAEACPKFAESNRLDRAAGTLIHLADCYEKDHKAASAWATFKDAASAARAISRADWEKLAQSHADALEPRLAKVTIRVDDPAPGIVVARDGVATAPASWGVAIPIDVGSHTVQATAPGRRMFSTTIVVARDGEQTVVVVPRLAAADGGNPSASPGAAVDRSDGSAQRTTGWIVGGVGLAGLAAGAITGLVAMSANDDSKRVCPNDGPCTSADAVAANDDARTFGTISTIAFAAGGVAVAAGAVLVLTAPTSAPPTASSTAARAPRARHASPLRVVPGAAPGGGGVSFVGVF